MNLEPAYQRQATKENKMFTKAVVTALFIAVSLLGQQANIHPTPICITADQVANNPGAPTCMDIVVASKIMLADHQRNVSASSRSHERSVGSSVSNANDPEAVANVQPALVVSLTRDVNGCDVATFQSNSGLPWDYTTVVVGVTYLTPTYISTATSPNAGMTMVSGMDTVTAFTLTPPPPGWPTYGNWSTGPTPIKTECPSSTRSNGSAIIYKVIVTSPTGVVTTSSITVDNKGNVVAPNAITK